MIDDDFTAQDFHMHKHSVLLDGHQTSVSLEDAFWQGLVAIAKERGQSINTLVTEIDHARTTNLSSAIRVFVLRHQAQ
ncbi:ribbon-helix-helix domain-containing protein [Magnetovibrio sp. PR-2]|uniref:ribbon-helix-helix domain-containing protein n=1 Tax=Magnetovibrio sp. PR-2 TaxID=3120356 RepID=UPI002FCE49BF